MTTSRTEQARDAVFYWQYEHATNFDCMLIELISKADARNKARLSEGFPEYVNAYLEWYEAEDTYELYKKWGYHDRLF